MRNLYENDIDKYKGEISALTDIMNWSDERARLFSDFIENDDENGFGILFIR
jgi:hypothetical protein